MSNPRVLVITGSVGVGKSTAADAISEILRNDNVKHAVIDMDYLRYAFPRPENDPFHRELSTKNLAAIWKNFQAIGIDTLIIPNVAEDRSDISDIEEALPGSQVTVVRLTANIETVHSRLHERHGKRDEANLAWHLDRAVELTEQLEKSGVEDFVVDTDNKTVQEVAKEVLAKWQETQNG